MKTAFVSVLSTAALALMASSALAATEISWWHAMTGANKRGRRPVGQGVQ